MRGRHCIRYTELPKRWSEGLPLGNGCLGVMCWSDGARLRFTFDMADAWDLRTREPEDPTPLPYSRIRALVAAEDFETLARECDARRNVNPVAPTKVYLGRLDLNIAFDADALLELRLEEAVLRGTLRHAGLEHDLRAFVDAEDNAFCFRLDPWPADATWQWVPFYESSPGLAALDHPPACVRKQDGTVCVTQAILPDKTFTLQWNTDGPETTVCVEADRDPAISAAEPDERYANHRARWADFWDGSAIELPDPDLEFLWYFGLYLLRSCARRDSLPPGLQGLWPMDGRNPPWRGDYHNDMNVQEMFWSACPAGHLELLDVWLDYMQETLPQAEAHTHAVFGSEGAFQPAATLPGHLVMAGKGWTPVAYGWSHTGWLAHLAWLRWRYSMDSDWLAERGYPLVRSAFLFYASTLEKEEDGFYHIPLSSSPEYEGNSGKGWCRDPNVDIALIRKCCDWIREMESALARNDLAPRAQEIHQHLVPYHLVPLENPPRRVLGLWKDKPLDASHRHPSHLMAIHPAMDLTIDGSEEERDIIEASLEHYLSLGEFHWAGHTYVQMVSFAAVLGLGEMADRFLKRYRDNWTLPNGLHFNRDIRGQGDSWFSVDEKDIDAQAPFTVNETCGVVCGICDMLVQGWGDRIRIFPAVPEHWTNLLFTDLLTEGAFRVSALRKEGQTCWVRIRAGVDRECRLRHPFGDQPFDVEGAEPARKEDDLVWPMQEGQTVTLFTPEHARPDLQAEAL